MRSNCVNFSLYLISTLISYTTPVTSHYDGQTCCEQAKKMNTIVNPPTNIVCGQSYSSSTPAAEPVLIPYSFCKARCNWWDPSEAHKPGEWAAPIVQFILPSFIFSVSIPRQLALIPKRRPRYGRLRARVDATWYAQLGRQAVSFILSVLILLVVVVDTLVWVLIILALAGPMMISGLHEALLDSRILKALRRQSYIVPTARQRTNDRNALELIVTAVSGNLLSRVGGPQTSITQELRGVRQQQRRQQLLCLMSAQSNFGPTIGIPVVFYLGAFIYTILDLLSQPSNQDAAIALAFGVEWMVVVHVAIIGGCLLASNNPSTAAALIGRQQLPDPGGPHSWFIFHPVYDLRFQPVSMWQRGTNKEEWLQQSAAWRNNDPLLYPNSTFRKDVRIGFLAWLGYIIIPTVILISVPPAAGAVVAWRTPPVGWGCRSLSLVCYAGCQFIVMGAYVLRLLWRSRYGPSEPWSFRWCFSRVFYGVFCFLSLFMSMGSTIMQVLGVYRNCFCYVNTPYWFKLDQAVVDVASDTQEQRHSSGSWIIMGSVATGFMAACAYAGWWYQKAVREEYETTVNSLG